MTDDEVNEFWVLRAAGQVMAASVFGPPPELLAGIQCPVLAGCDEPTREFRVFSSPVAYVYVYETESATGDVGRFWVEMAIEVEGAEARKDLTPTRARELAAMIVTAAEVFERLQAAGVGSVR